MTKSSILKWKLWHLKNISKNLQVKKSRKILRILVAPKKIVIQRDPLLSFHNFKIL